MPKLQAKKAGSIRTWKNFFEAENQIIDELAFDIFFYNPEFYTTINETTMAYDEQLTNRVREALIDQQKVEEIKMFQGLCFMVNDKMLICVRDSGLLCRIGQQQAALELETGNCRQMINGGRVMKDYVWVDGDEIDNNKKFSQWVALALVFNKMAKASKKRK